MNAPVSVTRHGSELLVTLWSRGEISREVRIYPARATAGALIVELYVYDDHGVVSCPSLLAFPDQLAQILGMRKAA